MKKLINHNTVIKYLLTGGLAFAVDYLLLLSCYYVFSLPLWVATTLGYLGGLCVSFFINRTWVFSERGKQRKMTRQLVEYVLLLLFNYAFTVFAIRLFDSRGISPAISKIVITAMIAGWNYIIFNKIIFAHGKDHSKP
jgi:putative flippase GtrA